MQQIVMQSRSEMVQEIGRDFKDSLTMSVHLLTILDYEMHVVTL